MPKVLFPDVLDDFRLPLSLDDFNAVQTTDGAWTLAHVLYLLSEMEQAMASVGVTDIAAMQEITASLAEAISALVSRVETLESTAIGKQHYEGDGGPSDSLGQGGDTYWDLTNKFYYVKLGGAWVQQA